MAKKWIQGAINPKEEGSLRAHFGVKEGEIIPAAQLNALIARLRKKASDEKKLSKEELHLLRQALLARKLRGY